MICYESAHTHVSANGSPYNIMQIQVLSVFVQMAAQAGKQICKQRDLIVVPQIHMHNLFCHSLPQR